MSKAELESKHLAQLHALALEAGIEGYRKLPREQLVEELLVHGDVPSSRAAESEDGEPKKGERRPRRRGRGRAGGSREREDDAGDEAGASAPEREQAEGEEVTGILDVLPQGHGFARLAGLDPADDDVYVSASQIRRCELRAGDEVTGVARDPRRGERHRALVRVERVNGAEPATEREDSFEKLTPVPPHRRIAMHAETDDVLVRAVDLLAPLAYGQRVLVRARPRSGRTTLLRGVAQAILAAPDAPRVIVLLVDERPEEVTEWRRLVPEAEIAAAAADLEPADQVRHAELAVSRARRRAESGEDVVLLIDSLTRLGVAARDPAAVKPYFGAGRELEEEGSGSLTVIATVLTGTDDGDGAATAVETTESSTIVLDPELAAAGVVPALDVAATGVAREDSLRGPEELEPVRSLRAELRAMPAEEAARALAERIRSSPSNSELLGSL
ncbi:MAG TPA: Rho termination factor N-terminal domain-containing protein [Solirubrobacterales bacterium]